jgi:hypothetical protein
MASIYARLWCNAIEILRRTIKYSMVSAFFRAEWLRIEATLSVSAQSHPLPPCSCSRLAPLRVAHTPARRHRKKARTVLVTAGEADRRCTVVGVPRQMLARRSDLLCLFRGLFLETCCISATQTVAIGDRGVDWPRERRITPVITPSSAVGGGLLVGGPVFGGAGGGLTVVVTPGPRDQLIMRPLSPCCDATI